MTLPPLAPAVERSLRRVVQGKARRGVFAGKHIRFGNKVSEDGGNKYVHTRARSRRRQYHDDESSTDAFDFLHHQPQNETIVASKRTQKARV
jgi:hypothetical protein